MSRPIIKGCHCLPAMCALLIASFLPNCQAAEENSLLLKWALTIKSSESEKETSTNENMLELSALDTFKFYLQPQGNSFLYFYHYSSKSELYLLYPEEKGSSGKWDVSGGWIQIPRERLVRFQLESGQEGSEKFYLIASRSRLTELELLSKKLASASDDNAPLARKNLLDEIARLTKKSVGLAAGIEKPTPIAGIVKGPDSTAYEIRRVDFYVKTISVTLKKPITQ